MTEWAGYEDGLRFLFFVHKQERQEWFDVESKVIMATELKSLYRRMLEIDLKC